MDIQLQNKLLYFEEKKKLAQSESTDYFRERNFYSKVALPYRKNGNVFWGVPLPAETRSLSWAVISHTAQLT